MQLQIQSTRFEADDKLMALVTKKFHKLEKLYDRIEKCSVTLKHEKNDRNKGAIVEVRLAVPGDDIFASERAESFEKAIDPLLGDLKRQLSRRKEKFLEHR